MYYSRVNTNSLQRTIIDIYKNSDNKHNKDYLNENQDEKNFLGNGYIDELYIIHKVYIGALLRICPLKDQFLIDLNTNSIHSLAPTEEYSNFIIDLLINKNFISPYQTPSRSKQVYIFEDLHNICINSIENNQNELLKKLMFPEKVSPMSDDGNILIHYLNELQSYEAIEYMILTIEEFNLYTFEVDERFEILFSRILIYYSESQLFNFIYTAVRNLTAYKSKNPNKYIPMANFIYKGISNRYEKAKLNKWTITDFNRPNKLPQSEVSKIVTDYMLGIGETYFYQPITWELLNR